MSENKARAELATLIYNTNPIVYWDKDIQDFRTIQFKDSDLFTDERIIPGIYKITDAVIAWALSKVGEDKEAGKSMLKRGYNLAKYEIRGRLGGK